MRGVYSIALDTETSPYIVPGQTRIVTRPEIEDMSQRMTIREAAQIFGVNASTFGYFAKRVGITWSYRGDNGGTPVAIALDTETGTRIVPGKTVIVTRDEVMEMSGYLTRKAAAEVLKVDYTAFRNFLRRVNLFDAFPDGRAATKTIALDTDDSPNVIQGVTCIVTRAQLAEIGAKASIPEAARMLGVRVETFRQFVYDNRLHTLFLYSSRGATA